MPKVKSGESRSDYVKRCVPIAMGEGLDQRAAVGKCEGMFDIHKSLIEKTDKVIKHLGQIISCEEEKEAIEKYSHEIEKNDLSENRKSILEKVYSKCRADGGEKNRCYIVALSSAARQAETSITKDLSRLEKMLHIYKSKINKQLIGECAGYKIFIVYEDEILDLIPEFSTAGNGQRYKEIPDNEVWLSRQRNADKNEDMHNIASDCVHEILENKDMRIGTDYDTAHARATKLEHVFRKENTDREWRNVKNALNVAEDYIKENMNK